MQAIRCGIAFHVQNDIGIEKIAELDDVGCQLALKGWLPHRNIYVAGADRPAYHDDRIPIVSFNILWPEEEGTPPSAVPPSQQGPSLFNNLRPPKTENPDGSPPSRRMLDPNFVAALLNDLYGIQARSGCACAGPYGFALWRADKSTADNIFGMAERNDGVTIRPGQCRVNFTYW